MAQYDQSSDELIDDFIQSDDLSDVSKAAIATILETEASEDEDNRVFQVEGSEEEVVVVPADTDVVEINTALGSPKVQIPAGKPMVVVIEGADGAEVVAEYDGTTISIVGGDGADVISFLEDNVSVAVSGGESSAASRVSASSTAPLGVTVEAAGGDDTIETTSGRDVIIGGAGNDRVTSGAGDDTISAGVGSDTIDAGAGWDQVILEEGDYAVEVVGSQIVIRNTGTDEETTSENAEYIALDSSTAVIAAANREDATAARQSEAILGSQMSSAELKAYNELVNAIGLDAASASLQESSGYTDATASLSDSEFIELQYQAILGRSADETGLAFYEGQLSAGAIDRGKLVADLSWSDEGIDSFDFIYTIDDLI